MGLGVNKYYRVEGDDRLYAQTATSLQAMTPQEESRLSLNDWWSPDLIQNLSSKSELDKIATGILDAGSSRYSQFEINTGGGTQTLNDPAKIESYLGRAPEGSLPTRSEELQSRPELTSFKDPANYPAKPIRNSGESILDFTKRVDTSLQLQPGETLDQYYARLPGSKPGSAVTGQSRVAISPSASQGQSGAYSAPVATSSALRLKEKSEALKEALGLGDAPMLPDIFGSTDQRSLDLARKERDAINKEMEGILAERLAIDAEFRKFQQNAGEGTTEAGRMGITSEEGRKVQEQYDALNRRELVLETKLGNRNAVIKELMANQRQEYADAVDQYNTRFSQALQLYNLFSAEEDRAERGRNELKANASANLDVLMGSIQAQIEAGQLLPGNISAVQRAQIQDLEVQAGLPLGSTLAVLGTLKAGEEKLYSGVDDFGNFVYISKDVNGKISVKKAAGAVPQRQPAGGGNNTTPTPGNTQEQNNRILSSIGLPLTVATSTGGLTQSALNKVVAAGVPLQVAQGIWQNIISGNSLEEIRQGLLGQIGDRSVAYGYLDKFMQSLQGSGSSREL